MSDRKVNKPQPSKVKAGHVMAFVYYAKVESVDSNGTRLMLENLDDSSKFQVNGKELVENSFSADQYQEEEKVTKTQAAEILVHSVNRPFTVSFQKANGDERVLKGRLVHPEPLLGRSMVEDLEKSDAKDRVRQVDHRTINFVIVDGIKYTVK